MPHKRSYSRVLCTYDSNSQDRFGVACRALGTFSDVDPARPQGERPTLPTLSAYIVCVMCYVGFRIVHESCDSNHRIASNSSRNPRRPIAHSTQLQSLAYCHTQESQDTKIRCKLGIEGKYNPNTYRIPFPSSPFSPPPHLFSILVKIPSTLHIEVTLPLTACQWRNQAI